MICSFLKKNILFQFPPDTKRFQEFYSGIMKNMKKMCNIAELNYIWFCWLKPPVRYVFYSTLWNEKSCFEAKYHSWSVISSTDGPESRFLLKLKKRRFFSLEYSVLSVEGTNSLFVSFAFTLFQRFIFSFSGEFPVSWLSNFSLDVVEVIFSFSPLNFSFISIDEWISCPFVSSAILLELGSILTSSWISSLVIFIALKENFRVYSSLFMSVIMFYLSVNASCILLPFWIPLCTSKPSLTPGTCCVAFLALFNKKSHEYWTDFRF